MLPTWKSTYLTLIPKTNHPSIPTDFHPINLCNIIYKVVANVLLNRMKPLFSALISSTQYAFVEGRSILENILIAQELMHSLQ